MNIDFEAFVDNVAAFWYNCVDVIKIKRALIWNAHRFLTFKCNVITPMQRIGVKGGSFCIRKSSSEDQSQVFRCFVTTEPLPFQRNSNVCAIPLNKDTTSWGGVTLDNKDRVTLELIRSHWLVQVNKFLKRRYIVRDNERAAFIWVEVDLF